jgi:hypothetical protein
MNTAGEILPLSGLVQRNRASAPTSRRVLALMATSNSPTFGQSNSPRQDGQIINFLVCLVLASFLGNFSLAFWIF